MRAIPWLLGVAPALIGLLPACVPILVTYYEPAGGKGRNATLCTFGVRNQLEVAVAPGVSVRISGGDPEGASLSAGVELIVPEGRRVQFSSDAFTLRSESPEHSYRVEPGSITTICYGEPPGCKTRLAPTDLLEGRTWKGSGLIPKDEPRMFDLSLVAPAPPVDAFSVQLPPLDVDGARVTLPLIRFEKVRKLAGAGLCQ
jgi:hypothetical protein